MEVDICDEYAGFGIVIKSRSHSDIEPSMLDEYLRSAPVSDAARSFVARKHKMLIGEDWCDAGSGERIDIREPSTGEILTSVPAATASDAGRAVTQARAAFDDRRWRGLMPCEQERILHRLADLIETHADELAVLESLDVGKPLSAARSVDVPEIMRYARYMAGFCTRRDGRVTNVSTPGRHFAYSVRQPVGVVVGIVPWNFPLVMSGWKILPALAAGCTIVLKPSEITPLSAIRLAELVLEAGVPPGVVNLVTGYGHAAGAALVDDARVDKVSFTGSVATGKVIGRAAMNNLARVTLELGGKSPVIVLPDADIKATARGVVDAVFFNSGQNCCAGSRLFAHKSIYEPLMAEISLLAAAKKLAPGFDAQCDLGPLASRPHMEKVLSYVEKGRAQGAELLTGGVQVGDAGYFVAPAVFSNTCADMDIVRDEIFGPVLSARPFGEIDEAVRAANASEFGLAASIWTNRLSEAHRLIPLLDAGTVWVNTHNLTDATLAFGGFKQSGIGRENGPENFDAFLETKSVWIHHG